VGGSCTSRRGQRSTHQLASGEIPVRTRDRIGSQVAQVAGDIATAVRNAGPANQREAAALAVVAVAVRDGKAALAREALRVGIGIVMLVRAELRIELQSLEITLHDEVDDAGERI